MASVILRNLRGRAGRFGRQAGATCRRRWWRRWTNWSTPTKKPRADAAFQAELSSLLADYAGRPTPLYFAKRLTESLAGARFISTRDLLHGAHKITTRSARTAGQTHGKKRVIAETAAARRGYGTVAACWAWNAWSTWHVDMERRI